MGFLPNSHNRLMSAPYIRPIAASQCGLVFLTKDARSCERLALADSFRYKLTTGSQTCRHWRRHEILCHSFLRSTYVTKVRLRGCDHGDRLELCDGRRVPSDHHESGWQQSQFQKGEEGRGR